MGAGSHQILSLVRPGAPHLLREPRRREPDGIEKNTSFHSGVCTAGQQVPAGDLLSVTEVLPVRGQLDNPCRLDMSTDHLPTQLMSDNLRIPDSLDMQRLQAMQLVAKMKESADKYGVGFIGGFVAPDGQKFVMSNMNDMDTQMLLPEDLK